MAALSRITSATDFLGRAARIDQKLADFIEDVANLEFSFRELWAGQDNRCYLWLPESLADRHPEIDLTFRCNMVEFIIERWKKRLKGYAPYQTHGFIIFMWQTLGPKISVISRDAEGSYPTPKTELTKSLRDFLTPLAKTSWGSHFSDSDGNWDTLERNLLETVDAMKGSIGKPTCQRLGLSLQEFRQRVEWGDLADEVNRLRKKHGRRPAKFVPYRLPREELLYELVLPPNYE